MPRTNLDTRPIPNTPEAKMALWQRRVEERLQILETVSRLESASIQNGVLRVIDSQGRRIVEIGALSSGGHGIEVYDAFTQNVTWSSKNP